MSIIPSLFTFKKRQITTSDAVIFLRQFATLIEAGIPLIQSCDLLEKSQEKTALRLLIYSIKREILAGKTLFHSLKPHPSVFDELTCQLIHMGECTGNLDKMLSLIARHQEKNLAFKKRIQQALFYPLVISITAFVMTFSLFMFVIPRFAELFHDTTVKLPLLTAWIFYCSDLLQRYSGLCLVILLSFLWVLFRSPYSRAIKRGLYQTLIQLPLLKSYMRKIILARFARNLAIALSAGIPLIEALSLTAATSGNMEFTGLITKLRNKIRSGLQLHYVMGLFPYFPALMVHMVRIGEESGKLEHMLDKTADFLEAEIDHFTGKLSQLLEPLIMLVLGVLIGGLVISLYLPIFKVGSAL